MDANAIYDYALSYRTLSRAEEACTILEDAAAKLSRNQPLYDRLGVVATDAERYVSDLRTQLIEYLTEHGQHVSNYTPPLSFQGGPRVRDDYDLQGRRYCVERGGNLPDELRQVYCADDADDEATTISALRAAAGMTQKQMYEHLGIPRRTLENWCRGVRDCPQYVADLIEYRLRAEGYIK